MSKKGSVREPRQGWKGLDSVFGSAPWLKAKEAKNFRVKVFKSGNSLALRLPAGLGLAAGTEMDLRVEDGGYFTLEPVERPKRKVNIGKFWGTVPDLEMLRPEDRLFEESPRPWDDPDWPTWQDRPR